MTSTNSESDILLCDEPVFPESDDGRRRRLDYLGYAPCPLRSELRRRLHATFQENIRPDRPAPAWFMPAGCHSPNPYDELWLDSHLDDFPSLISEVGFGDFTRKAFADRWLLNTNHFEAIGAPTRPEFQQAGLIDPNGRLHVYAVNAEVVLVDRARLGDRPAPRSWEDILHERFRNDLVVSGEEGNLHETKLFALHSHFGEGALEALGRNVRGFMHPAEMAKTAGTAHPEGAALYLLPWFFAKACPRKETTAVVWPADGALGGLLYLLQRRMPTPGALAARQFLLGETWSRHLSRVGFPAAASGESLPGPLRWAGWDYVYKNDLETLRPRLNEAFIRGRRKNT